MERKRDLKATLYKDRQNRWRWKIVAGNGKVVGMSTRGYKDRSDCRDVLELILSLEASDRQEKPAKK